MMLCMCGHVKAEHEHYRAGTDCAGRNVVSSYPDGTLLTTRCECPEYRGEKHEAVRIAAIVVLTLIGIFVTFYALKGWLG